MFGIDIVGIATIGILIAFVLFLMVSCFQKCGPNEAMIVSGFGATREGRPFKIFVGDGTVILPLIQQRATLSLETMTIDVVSQAPMITKSGVPIFVEGVAQIKVQNNLEAIATAAQQFLNKSQDEIAAIAHQTLIGHLRAILGTMQVEELIQNFERFSSLVQEVSGADLAHMGKENVGYLEALGRNQTEIVKRNAAIAIAENQKQTQIAQAQAQREAAIEQAKAQRDAAIFQAQASQEQATAKLQADTLVAEATKNFQVSQAAYQAEVSAKKAASDMSYDIAKAQTQQKLVQETQQIKIVESAKEVELQQVAVQRRQVELEA